MNRQVTGSQFEVASRNLSAVPAAVVSAHWRKRASGVLIVVHDDELALALEDALESAGFNVETVASIDDALALGGCRFEMVVLPSRAEPGDYAGLLTCLAGNPGAICLPVSLEASVSRQTLAGFLDSLRAAIEERKRAACRA